MSLVIKYNILRLDNNGGNITFEIITNDWSVSNFFPGPNAKVTISIDKEVICDNTEFSMYLSLPNLLTILIKDNKYQKSHPIFICSCGEIGCNFFDYEIRHNDDGINIEIYRRPESTSSQQKPIRYNVELSTLEYVDNLISILKEYISYVIFQNSNSLN
jgi:hypothetical protein